jgi:hypothetical protein
VFWYDIIMKVKIWRYSADDRLHLNSLTLVCEDKTLHDYYMQYRMMCKKSGVNISMQVHYQPINDPIAGAQAFLTDRTKGGP